MRHVTHCALRLGDNLAHLHFLRKLLEAYPEDSFRHYLHAEYIPQCVELVSDLSGRIELRALPVVSPEWRKWRSKPPEDSIDAWKNAGRAWETHPQRNDYCVYMLLWFRHLAKKMGRESPLHEPSDLLFDYPALHLAEPQKAFRGYGPWILVINSRGLSGQAAQCNYHALDLLTRELADRNGGLSGNVVATHPWGGRCTLDTDMTVTGIGHISQHASLILMIANGPSWPTFNIWNKGTPRIAINEENLRGLDPSMRQCITVAEMRDILLADGLLCSR